MKKIHIALQSILLTVFAITLCACVSKPYLAKQQYILDAGAPHYRFKQTIPGNLTVQPTLASPPFDGTEFIYRTTWSRFMNDYYDVFMTPPASQVTSNIAQYLNAIRLFTHSNTSDLLLPGNYQLKSQLLALYADYRNDHKPMAVIKIQFILMKGDKIAFSTIIRSRIHFHHKNTRDLVKAWNKGLRNVLYTFGLECHAHFYPNSKAMHILKTRRERKAKAHKLRLQKHKKTTVKSGANTAQTGNFLTLPGYSK